MIKKSDIVQIFVISVVLLLVGIFLIYYSQKTLKISAATNIGATIDKFLLSAKGEINDMRVNQIQKIKEIAISSEKMSDSYLSALKYLGWFLICIGAIQLPITYSFYKERYSQLSNINKKGNI